MGLGRWGFGVWCCGVNGLRDGEDYILVFLENRWYVEFFWDGMLFIFPQLLFQWLGCSFPSRSSRFICPEDASLSQSLPKGKSL